MKPSHAASLALATALLIGCASPKYWYEPPASVQQSGPSLGGKWQGLARHDYSYRLAYGAIAGRVEVDCARYEDLIQLQIDNGQLQGALGTAPVFRFTTPISASGDFRHQMAVQGDTWIYGGVGIYDNQPTLKIWGRLDPFSGIGAGWISVTPKGERIGCNGRFQVSRNSAPPRPVNAYQPFKIKYWIDRVEGSDGHRPWIKH